MQTRTIDLAIQALEAERAKLEGAIAELKASLNGHRTARRVARGVMLASLVESTRPRVRRARRRLTAAGRKALSEAARRRWAKARAAGRHSL